MTRLLAFNDQSPAAAAVGRTAEALGTLLSATVDMVHVVESPTADGAGSARDGAVVVDEPASRPGRTRSGKVVEVLLDELDAPDVEAAVLGCRAVASKPEPAGHVATALLGKSKVPLVIIPADGRDLPARNPRLLLPLDGDSTTDTAVLSYAERLVAAGAQLMTLHVFDSASLPPFVGSTHDVEVLAQEFAVQHLPSHTGPSHVRIGEAGQEILSVCTTEAADAIVVAWHQNLSVGRADVVRRLLRESDVPLIMVPIG